MEQSLPLSGSDVPRMASVRQTIAAVLFVLLSVWGMLSPYLDGYLAHTFRIEYISVVLSVKSAVSYLLLTAGYALLISGAANRATKTALLLLCFMSVLLLLFVVLRVLSVFGDSTFFSIYGSCTLFSSVLDVYAFSVILRSNELDRNTASWIGLFIVGGCTSIMFGLRNVLGVDSIELLYETGFGSLLTLFHVVWVVLMIVAYVRFARCAAFSGAGTPEPAGVWSPVNRYMAAAIVAPAVTLLALWALIRFAAPWLSSL